MGERSGRAGEVAGGDDGAVARETPLVAAREAGAVDLAEQHRLFERRHGDTGVLELLAQTFHPAPDLDGEV